MFAPGFCGILGGWSSPSSGRGSCRFSALSALGAAATAAGGFAAAGDSSLEQPQHRAQDRDSRNARRRLMFKFVSFSSSTAHREVSEVRLRRARHHPMRPSRSPHAATCRLPALLAALHPAVGSDFSPPTGCVGVRLSSGTASTTFSSNTTSSGSDGNACPLELGLWVLDTDGPPHGFSLSGSAPHMP